MPNRLAIVISALTTVLALSPVLGAQTGTSQTKQEKWNNVPPPESAYAGKKSGPAPRRDLSGIWDGTAPGGKGINGAKEYPAVLPGGKGIDGGQPDERNIVHPLPYTALGEAALKANHPSGPGVRTVPSALSNDPLDSCDPIGFPQMELYELDTIEIIQTANQVVYLNGFYGNYRTIWTDGRELPKDPEPRWNGYSVGKWVDDYTFVVQTIGMNEKTWLDHAGRPHSDALRVEERFHRVDHDHMELTVIIDDPKMYAQPWVAVNKYPLQLLQPDFDIPELLCSPSAMADYNKQVASTLAKPKPPKN